MPHPNPEAELEHTKMSFGEHLEELRRALFRSITALVLGFLIGLIFGRQVVDYIQGPLRDSLQRHYLRQAKAEQLAYLEEQRTLGVEVPKDLGKAAEKMVQEGLVPREYYASPDELATALGAHYPDLAKQLEARPQPKHRADKGDAAAGDDADAVQDEDAALLAAFNRDDLVHLRLYTPIESDLRLRIVELNVQAPFIIYLKAALAVGAVIASPFVFFFIWDFVAAGLYRSERKHVYVYLPLSIGLFLAGAWIAYFEAFPYVLDFLFWYFETMNIDPDMRLSEWITLVLLMPIGFGVSFQLPLAMLLLERVGIFTLESYTSKWKVAVVVISVLAMVLSPGGDPYSMMFMFFPLTGLYFLGILLCRYMPGGHLRRKGIDPPPPADMAGS